MIVVDWMVIFAVLPVFWCRISPLKSFPPENLPRGKISPRKSGPSVGFPPRKNSPSVGFPPRISYTGISFQGGGILPYLVSCRVGFSPGVNFPPLTKRSLCIILITLEDTQNGYFRAKFDLFISIIQLFHIDR